MGWSLWSGSRCPPPHPGSAPSMRERWGQVLAWMAWGILFHTWNTLWPQALDLLAYLCSPRPPVGVRSPPR